MFPLGGTGETMQRVQKRKYRGWQLVSQPVSPSVKQRGGLCVRMSYLCMYVFVSVSSLSSSQKCPCYNPLLLRAFLQQTRQRPPIRLTQKRSFLLFLFSQTLLQHFTFLPNTPCRHSIIHFFSLLRFSHFLPSRTDPFHSFPGSQSVSHSRTRTNDGDEVNGEKTEREKTILPVKHLT